MKPTTDELIEKMTYRDRVINENVRHRLIGRLDVLEEWHYFGTHLKNQNIEDCKKNFPDCSLREEIAKIKEVLKDE